MKHKKQVNKTHYQFHRYLKKPRWSSLWHQLDEVIKLKPENVLEIGPGAGVFKQNAAHFNIQVETLDLDPELKPDYVGSADSLPFANNSYDVVCAFQMLEHLPYEIALRAFSEMARVSKKNIVISLPDSTIVWRYTFYIPKLGSYTLHIPRPRLRAPTHKFDGEHYWEIGKKGYELNKITSDFKKFANLIATYRVEDNPYHRFFVFET
jgi:predicted SAM-dependent methyltransferase